MSESSIPSNLRYTKDHEWARAEADGTVTVGITTHAVDQLGDITLVTLPGVGASITAANASATSTRSRPSRSCSHRISGAVVAVNEHLNDSPEAVNAEPYGVGWMLRIRPSDPDALAGLLSAEQYIRHVAENG